MLTEQQKFALRNAMHVPEHHAYLCVIYDEVNRRRRLMWLRVVLWWIGGGIILYVLVKLMGLQ